MKVILYSTGCPQCNILKEMLQKKNIIFQIEDNVVKMKELGFLSLPMLSVDGKIFSGTFTNYQSGEKMPFVLSE